MKLCRIRRFLKTAVLIPALASSVFAQSTSDVDVLPDFKEESRAILNDQLRRTNRRLIQVEDAYVSTTIFNAKYDTSTGHDHDGTDSKKVLATDLVMTGITDGHFLYNNAGVLAGKVNPGLSNVVFQWNGHDGAGSDRGLTNAGSLLQDFDGYVAQNLYFGVYDTTYKTILVGKFIKIAGISTITINARLWAESTTSSVEAILNVDVGGQSNTVKSVESSTPTWVTAATIDVSSLTNGTTYDITIQLKNEGFSTAYCSAVVLTGS